MNKYHHISAVLATIAVLVIAITLFVHVNTTTTVPAVVVPITITSTTTGAMGGVSSNTDWEKGMTIVTTSNSNKTVYLKLNERFVIQFGSTLKWNFVFSPSNAISRVPNSTTANGIQGVYSADKKGTTILHATGAPICDPHQMCPQFLQSVTITFVVE